MNTPAKGKPVLLDLVGFDDRSRAALELAIGNHAKGRCMLAHASVATAVLVDLDRAGSIQAWEKYEDRYPGRVAIFTSLYEGKQPDGAPFLKKPIAIEKFVLVMDGVLKAGTAPTQRTEVTRRALPAGGTQRSVATHAAARTVRTVRTVRQAPKRTQTLPLSRVNAVSSPQGPVRAARVDLPVPSSFDLATQRLSAPAKRASAPEQPAQVDEGPIERLPDIDCDDPAAIAARTQDGGALLLTSLRTAAAKVAATKKAHRVRLKSQDWVTFSADGTTVWTNLAESELDAACVAVLEAPPVLPCLPEEEKLAESVAKWTSDTEALLWRAAATTYRGRMPAGTDPKARVYLSRWPNLTRVLEIPNAVRIAALWAEQRLSLAFTAEILKIPQRHVFAFYGAAQAAGLAGPVQRSEDIVVAQVRVEPSARRGLFSKILDRLKGVTLP